MPIVEVVAGMDPRLPLGEIAGYAKRVESLGFDTLHVPETIHDSLAVALLALQATRELRVRTAVTLAFVRSPTLVAYTAWDLAKLSGGRFELGLGSQIRQNIEDRFGMPFGDPVARMREYAGALHALWAAFRSGGQVRYDAASYRITRLQPYFNPGPDDAMAPLRIWLGAVNPVMCRLAGEVTAGVVAHPTNSDPGYLRDTVRPAVTEGARAAARDAYGIGLVAAATIAVGRDDAAVAAARERQRRLLAFLYSTPAYRAALDRHGWPDLPGLLQDLVRAQEWDRLSDVVTDEILDRLVVSGRYEQVAVALAERFGGVATGVALPPLGDPTEDDDVGRLVERLAGRPGREVAG